MTDFGLPKIENYAPDYFSNARDHNYELEQSRKILTGLGVGYFITQDQLETIWEALRLGAYNTETMWEYKCTAENDIKHQKKDRETMGKAIQILEGDK